MLFQCKKCKNKRVRTQIPGTPKAKWKNERGNRWNGLVCPECCASEKSARWRARALPEINYKSNPAKAKGRLAEERQKMFFEKMGFNVAIARHAGPDLILEKNNKRISVEVKSVTIRKDKTFCVSRVKKNRVNDDWICFVTDKKEFYVEFMKDHLPKCSKDGQRGVTQLYRSGAFLPLPK